MCDRGKVRRGYNRFVMLRVLIRNSYSMPHRIKPAFAFFSIAVCFFYACQPNDVRVKLPPDYFTIVTNESVSTQAGVTIIGDTIRVSICPQNAYCIIPDNVSVSVRLVKGSDSQRLRLFAPISNFKRRPNSFYVDSTSVVLDSQPYKVILRGGKYVGGNENVSQAIIQVSRL